MDYAFIMIGSFVAIVALFKRDVLIDRTSALVVLGLSIASLIAGVALHFTDMGRHSASGALIAPPFCFGIYRVLRHVFVRRLHHEPKDTYMDWTPGMPWDRFFNIVFFTGSFLLTMFTAIGMEELSKRGW